MNLGAETVAALERHRVAQVVTPIEGHVFTNPDGSPMSPEVVSRTFADLVRESGLPKIRLP